MSVRGKSGSGRGLGVGPSASTSISGSLPPLGGRNELLCAGFPSLPSCSDASRPSRWLSVALNLAEGMYSRGKNRAVRYHTALGSARETWSCLEVAEAAGYIKLLEPALSQRLNQVMGTLVRIVERSQ